ncbi:MAG: S-formylglutathione hydrolase [Myxococcales bacterium]|nr:S-formylglutathione hydrolase [Myxococcales bacterium]
MGALRVRSEQRCFGGVQGFYEHDSAACAGPMRFGVFVPAGAKRAAVLTYLAGLTCTEETFVQKAGAQRIAAELGLVLVTPDTSPRAARFPGDDAAWDFGVAAGFYLDATAEPWASAYRMFTHVTAELPDLIEANFPVDGGRAGVFGHSMGGHGALVAALRAPARFRSVSAFAPIAAPTECPWGEKAFGGYLGQDRAAWRAWDATALVESGRRFPGKVLVDQGTSDKFLVEQLKPERLEQACRAADLPHEIRRHEGYDHSYFFIATFVEDHLRHHAAVLGQ